MDLLLAKLNLLKKMDVSLEIKRRGSKSEKINGCLLENSARREEKRPMTSKSDESFVQGLVWKKNGYVYNQRIRTEKKIKLYLI